MHQTCRARRYETRPCLQMPERSIRELRTYYAVKDYACNARSPTGGQLEVMRQGTLGIHGAGDRQDAFDVCERLRHQPDVGIDVLAISRRLMRLEHVRVSRARRVSASAVLFLSYSGDEREWFRESVPEGLAIVTWVACTAYAAAVEAHTARVRAADDKHSRKLEHVGRVLCTPSMWWRCVQRLADHGELVSAVKAECHFLAKEALEAYRRV